MTCSISVELLEAERHRCQALLDGDVGKLSAMLSEHLYFMHANAVADDRPSLLAKMRQGTIVYHELKVSEERVIELGAAAVLTSRLTARVSVGGVLKTIDNRTMSVWVVEDGTWKLLAYQPTPVPPVLPAA